MKAIEIKNASKIDSNIIAASIPMSKPEPKNWYSLHLVGGWRPPSLKPFKTGGHTPVFCCYSEKGNEMFSAMRLVKPSIEVTRSLSVALAPEKRIEKKIEMEIPPLC